MKLLWFLILSDSPRAVQAFDKMALMLKSELQALSELMSDLLLLDPQQMVADLYQNGIVDVQEAAAILDEANTLHARMFSLLKYSFSPYKDMACSPFMVLLFTLMKYHPSLALSLRQKQVKIQEHISSQTCNSQELLSTYQTIFFTDKDSHLARWNAVNHANLSNEGYISLQEPTPVTTDIPDDRNKSFTEKEDMMSTKLFLYSNPPLIEELDSKRLVEALDTIELKYQNSWKKIGGGPSGNLPACWNHTAPPSHFC